MPIETPEAPKPSTEALRALLPAFIASAGTRQTAPHFAASLLASPQSLASPSPSYPAYALGLADVAAGAGAGMQNSRLAARVCSPRRGRLGRGLDRPAPALCRAQREFKISLGTAGAALGLRSRGLRRQTL